jgi:hypothetical protein
MDWETPRFEEIRMDAEIGGYQPDEEAPRKEAQAEESSEPISRR